MLAGVRMTPPRDYREKKQRACGGWEAGGHRVDFYTHVARPNTKDAERIRRARRRGVTSDR